MKKHSFLFVFTFLLTVNSFTGFAQDKEPEIPRISTPKWVSELGYWVMESNVNTPGNTLIRFYNNENVLVYKENLDGVIWNLKKRRTKMRLKKLVDQAVTTYAQKQRANDNKMLVMNPTK